MFHHSEIILSFIIPTIDDQRIENAITSIISSTRWSSQDCELIVVVNNCPEYFYKKLYEKFSSPVSKKNIKILYLARGSIAQARNLGIKISRGQYLIHIDSDCKLAPNYIEILRKYLSSQKILIGRGTIEFISFNNLLSRANCELKRLVYFGRREKTYTPNLIVRRDLYRKIGLFNEKLSHGEDLEWTQRLINFKITPAFFTDLVLEHIDQESIYKILITYFYYGVGRTYRFKKYILVNKSGFKKLKTFYQLFDEIPKLQGINFINKPIILLLYLIRNIGVIYGLFKWSVIK